MKQRRPESQALPLSPRCDTGLPVSLCWFANRSPWFCFCFPVVVSTEHGQSGGYWLDYILAVRSIYSEKSPADLSVSEQCEVA